MPDIYDLPLFDQLMRAMMHLLINNEQETFDMANYTDSKLKAVLKDDKVSLFLSFFFTKRKPTQTERNYKFPRTTLNDYSIDPIGEDLTRIRINFSCAWSIRACLLDKQKDAESLDYIPITMEEAIEKCEIIKLKVTSKEEGFGFLETLTYNREESEKLRYQTVDLPDEWDADWGEGE